MLFQRLKSHYLKQNTIYLVLLIHLKVAPGIKVMTSWKPFSGLMSYANGHWNKKMRPFLSFVAKSNEMCIRKPTVDLDDHSIILMLHLGHKNRPTDRRLFHNVSFVTSSDSFFIHPIPVPSITRFNRK